jgi:hypothetical protein
MQEQKEVRTFPYIPGLCRAVSDSFSCLCFPGFSTLDDKIVGVVMRVHCCYSIAKATYVRSAICSYHATSTYYNNTTNFYIPNRALISSAR